MKKTKSKSTPQTLHDLLMKEFGKKSLAYTAQCMLAEEHHSQCTFENNFWEYLRNRGDKRFEEYNKATGLGRSAFCLRDNGNYVERAIICDALTAYIKMLKEEASKK